MENLSSNKFSINLEIPDGIVLKFKLERND